MYKAVWTPTIGKRLCVQREPRNAHDRRAVAVLTSEDTLVGHAPREISKIFWHFLSYGTITCEVTGPRKHGNGLEVPWVSVEFDHFELEFFSVALPSTVIRFFSSSKFS